MNFEDINPLNKYEIIWVTKEKNTCALNLELPSALALKLISFSTILIFFFYLKILGLKEL